MPSVYIGTSGFTYTPWKGSFYPVGIPQSQWLAYYASHFDTVEINATFYRSFSSAVFKRWYEITPENFHFALKGPKLITHNKQLENVSAQLGSFFSQVRSLKEKLAVVLWQLPATFLCDSDTYSRLEKFVRILPQDMRHVLEFRHASWFCTNVYTMLNTNKLGMVINDTPVFPTQEKLCSNIAYVRFHGPMELYASSYTAKQLTVWAEKIHTYQQTADVYGYFNNDVSGYAVTNAKELVALLQ